MDLLDGKNWEDGGAKHETTKKNYCSVLFISFVSDIFSAAHCVVAFFCFCFVLKNIPSLTHRSTLLHIPTNKLYFGSVHHKCVRHTTPTGCFPWESGAVASTTFFFVFCIHSTFYLYNIKILTKRSNYPCPSAHDSPFSLRFHTAFPLLLHIFCSTPPKTPHTSPFVSLKIRLFAIYVFRTAQCSSFLSFPLTIFPTSLGAICLYHLAFGVHGVHKETKHPMFTSTILRPKHFQKEKDKTHPQLVA